MTAQDQIEIVKKEVVNYFNQNAEYTGVANLGDSERNHIIEIGTSILCTKWKVGYPGGGFVQSFVDNDLMATFLKADSTVYKSLRFFVMLTYNTSKPFIFEQ
jgi:hypothetical protein